MRYVIHTKVLTVEERFSHRHTSGFGKEALFEKVPLGFFLHMEGSREALFIGFEKPELAAGDLVRIMIEKKDAP